MHPYSDTVAAKCDSGKWHLALTVRDRGREGTLATHLAGGVENSARKRGDCGRRPQ